MMASALRLRTWGLHGIVVAQLSFAGLVLVSEIVGCVGALRGGIVKERVSR